MQMMTNKRYKELLSAGLTNRDIDKMIEIKMYKLIGDK